MTVDEARKILGEAEYRRIRMLVILQKGVLGFGGSMFLHDPHKEKTWSSKSFYLFFVVLCLALLAGYGFGWFYWESEKEKILEEKVALLRSIPRRTPMTKSSFRFFMIAPLVGLAIIALHLYFTSTSLNDYFLPALLVGVLILLQFNVFLGFQEENYLLHTTTPQPLLDLKASLRRYWPTLLFVIFLYIDRAFMRSLALFLVFLVSYYPSQKQMYLRSIREFGEPGAVARNP